MRVFSYVLLTVHLRIFISVINQLDERNFCFTVSLFHVSTCFEYMCSSSGSQNCITHPLVSSHLYICKRALVVYLSNLTNLMHNIFVLQYHHTYKFDDTRSCVMQFWPPDDEHICSKYVETWNKLIVKQNFCASSWLITDINNQCRFTNMFNHMLSFLTNMFQSLLWPLSGCVITRILYSCYKIYDGTYL